MNEKVRPAFDRICRGYSPDRVIADPDLNRDFLAACRELAAEGSDASLNRALLNLRKRGEMRGLRSKRSSFANEDGYRFASEMAIRFIERRDGITLDDVICDPELAAEFDSLAARLAPGFSPLECRWAALRLRKSNRLKPEILSRVVDCQEVRHFCVHDLDVSQIPTSAGMYILYCGDCALYVGEAQNLNARLRKHLDHSDNKAFAR
jgi:site-specific DNA-methyltransferase (adenine-specific)